MSNAVRVNRPPPVLILKQLRIITVGTANHKQPLLCDSTWFWRLCWVPPPPTHPLQNWFWQHWSVYIIKTTRANTAKRSESSAGLTRLQEQEEEKGSAATWRIIRTIKKVLCCDVTVRFVEVLSSPDFILLLNAIDRSQICWKDAAFPVFNPLPGIFILFGGVMY